MKHGITIILSSFHRSPIIFLLRIFTKITKISSQYLTYFRTDGFLIGVTQYSDEPLQGLKFQENEGQKRKTRKVINKTPKITRFRSSHRRYSIKKVFLKNSQNPQPATLLKEKSVYL